jgi:hypothetical protein
MSISKVCSFVFGRVATLPPSALSTYVNELSISALLPNKGKTRKRQFSSRKEREKERVRNRIEKGPNSLLLQPASNASLCISISQEKSVISQFAEKATRYLLHLGRQHDGIGTDLSLSQFTRKIVNLKYSTLSALQAPD